MRLVTIVAALAALAVSAQAADLEIKTLKVLVPIYRGDPADAEQWLTDEDVAGIQAGIERGRVFYFRNTFGRLNLEIEYLLIDEPAPDSEGPTYEFLEADLASRGVGPGDYDGVFTTGTPLAGNWGGFDIFEGAGAAFGMPDVRGGLTWYPEDEPGVWYGVAWTFVHEFQHAFDLVIAGEYPEVLHGHPYADCMERPDFPWRVQGAQHWSWEAATLRDVAPKVLKVRGARDESFTVTDTDGDGLADADDRLPVDERRLGSDPTNPDTDGDGLNDLDEFCADIFLGADPTNPDTDGDGIPDGADAHPTVALAPAVSYTVEDLTVDGVADGAYGPLFLSTVVANDDGLASTRIDAAWNEGALFLLVRADEPLSLYLEIDSSPENGYWEGGDTYIIRADGERVTFGGLGLSGDVPGAECAFGGDGLEIKIPAVIGQGASHEINWGGQRSPADVTDGLQLWGDGGLGLNVQVSRGADRRALFTPNWEMFATSLAKPSDAPARPSLRGTAEVTSDAVPTALVRGVGPADVVSVHAVAVADLGGPDAAPPAVAGKRIGPGPVLLTDLPARGAGEADGGNLLIARVGDQESDPAVLVWDVAAEAPALSLDGGVLSVTGEPNAEVEVFLGDGTHPLQVVTSAVLDGEGRGSVELPASLEGFLGAYAVGIDFGPATFARVDREINFNYEGGGADDRLPLDGFCVRWTGALDVPADGEYTFYLTSDDGSRLYLDGAMVIDNWGHHGDVEKTWTGRLAAGQHPIRIDYYEEFGWGAAYFEWSGPGIERTFDIPVSALPVSVEGMTWLARQTDRAGNVSPFAVAR